MLSGQLYNAHDPELEALRAQARRNFGLYNQTDTADQAGRTRLLTSWFGKADETTYIEPPFYCDYGTFIFLGENVFMNFDCVILDCAEVHIGDRTMFGPKVQLYTATHPLEAHERIKGPELARPITIGKNCWIGGGAIINPGVTIGDNTTIGSGSVVTKDIPANVFAAGNPCRVIRAL